jgi:hypothetical protein
MPADQKEIWLNDHIWPEIHAMMHNDAYFRLWLQAQELAERPYGPIAQTIINGYATYQLAGIRRMCDRSASGISLPKLLYLIRKEQPHSKQLLARSPPGLTRNAKNSLAWHLSTSLIMATQQDLIGENGV